VTTICAEKRSLSRGPAPEIGLGSVTLTDEGRSDPVLGPAGRYLPVLHWHADTFTLPPHAVRLAVTDRDPNQAFRVGSAYGLQFHVEVDPPALDAIAPHLPSHIRVDRRHAALITRAGRGVLTRWAGRILGLAVKLGGPS
jgi:GMP synthase-like glutamine amidotransferase